MKLPEPKQITTAYLSNLSSVATIVADRLERLYSDSSGGKYTHEEAHYLLDLHLHTLKVAVEKHPSECEYPE